MLERHRWLRFVTGLAMASGLSLTACGEDSAVGIGGVGSQSGSDTGSGSGTDTDNETATGTAGDPCANGMQDGDETDVDCGGSCNVKCGSGQGCGGDEDCEEGTVCTDDGVCGQMGGGNCEDGRQNGDETDVDCGGSCPDACGDGGGCGTNEDCLSGVCEGDVCQTPACDDTVQNGDETDVDCGGSCPPCDDGGGCVDDVDCLSGVCEAGMCVPPTCMDMVQNADETDVDCGGSCPPCGDGGGCLDGQDCQSGVCDNGVCLPPACDDMVQNGDETDLDCGGSCGPTCEDGEDCLVGNDCISLVCDPGSLTCSTPACDDGVQNGDETDVDCGGSCGMTCDEGEDCLVDADCISGSCDAGTLTCDPNVSVTATPPCSNYIGAPVQLQATAMGGTGNYTYSWTPATGLDDPSSATPLASPAGFETYTVTVDDGVNQAQDTVTVVNSQPFNLQDNCTLYQSDLLLNPPPASITYQASGTVACEQGNNNFGLHLCEGVTFQQVTLVGGMDLSGATTDNDWVGLVWGAQDNANFYSLVWKQAAQTVPEWNCTSPPGILVKRVEAADFASLLGEDLYCAADTAQSTVLETPLTTTTQGWEYGETYTVTIAYSDAGSDIVVERDSDATVIANFTVADTTFTSGYFGSTVLSQANACSGPLFASCL